MTSLVQHKSFQEKIPFYIGLLLGLAIVPIGLTGWGLDYFPGDLGDARFNLYILEHGYKFITGQIDNYWMAPFMFPESNVISYSDNLLGIVPIYSLFRLLGFEIFSAFQLLFISLFALNYSCFYFFAKWLFKNRYAAVVGAFVFAFSLATQVEMAHIQVIPRFFIPLAFWMILQFTEDFKPRYFFLALLCLTGELYASIYLGLLTFLSGGLLLLVTLLSNLKKLIPNFRISLWWIQISIGIGINLILIYGLMRQYVLRSDMLLKPPYSEILSTIPTPLSFLYSKPGSIIWEFLNNIGNSLPFHWNQQLFPGGIALLSFVILLGFFILKFRKLSNPIIHLIANGLIVFFLFIRIGDNSLYKLIHWLPGYDSMRSMDRIINIHLLYFGIAAGWCFSFAFRENKKWQLQVFLLIAVSLGIDNYVMPEQTYRTQKEIGIVRLEELVDKMKDIPKNSIISYEPDSVNYPVSVQLDAMLASQYLGLKCVNGYTSTSPLLYTPYWFKPNESNRKNWLESVHAEQLKVYVVK